MKILVTGGAGYIGSHTVVDLVESGHVVEIVDNLANSKAIVADRIAEITGVPVPLHVIDLRDRPAIDALLRDGGFDGVIHFAGLKAVGESGQQPLRYWQENLDSVLSLVEAMDTHDVRTLVFSSSATVYGENAPVPYVETFAPLESNNVYGRTKVTIEHVLTDIAAADDRWRIALLRYFNPVGAHESGLIGEDPVGIPNNLMPYLCQVASGVRDKLSIFGNDYPTADGTCERDFVHVNDLAAGHRVAVDHLLAHDAGVHVWNLGTGKPVSVLQLVTAFEAALGRELSREFAPRRAGDLASYYADASKAKAELGWEATRTVEEMCADSIRWQTQNPQGYV